MIFVVYQRHGNQYVHNGEKMNGQKLTILCADDEPSICGVLGDYFEPMGHKFESVENGVVAYDLVRVQNYDLLFMDLTLPVLCGTYCIKAIREINKSIYIVSMSGCTPEAALKGLHYGANAFMPKPFDLTMLDKHVASAFQQKIRSGNSSRECLGFSLAVSGSHKRSVSHELA
jgi:DNA-binding response OmpR family regulator